MSPRPTNLRRQAQQGNPTPTRVNLGPLTTTFYAPSHCSRNAIACSTCAGAIRGQTCRVNGATVSAEDDTGCWPRATAYPADKVAPLAGLGFYSPGVMCPMGYASACTAISTTRGQRTSKPQVTGQFQFPLVAGETAVGCCPAGYGCAIIGGLQTCHQIATSTAFDAMSCNGNAEVDLNGFQVPFTNGAVTIATMDLYAPMIQINRMASDLPDEVAVADETLMAITSTRSLLSMSVLPSSTATGTSATSTSDGILPDVRQIAERIDPQNDGKLNLSTKIGIAFAPLIVAAFVCAVIFYLKWKKKYLYPEEHFHVNKPSSPAMSEATPNNDDAEAGSQVPRDMTSTFPNTPAIQDSPYVADHHPHDFATQDGGPGPVFVTTSVYPSGAAKVADIDEGSQSYVDNRDFDIQQATAAAAGFGRRSMMDEPTQSPIDGTSPFRPQHGDTLKHEDPTLTGDREMGARIDLAPTAKCTPPLALGHTSSCSQSASSSLHSSQDGIEWIYPGLKREQSFSRPRPRTVVSSFYGDERSSVYSWNNASAPNMPDQSELHRVKSLTRAESWGARSRREDSASTLMEGAVDSNISRAFVEPRVTSQGVDF